MVGHNLFKNVKLDTAFPFNAAGTTDAISTGFDMNGWDGIACILNVGAITTDASLNLHAEMSTALAGTYVDIANSAAYLSSGSTVATTGEYLVVDVYRPTKNWVRFYADKATANTELYGGIAFRYRAASLPVAESTRAEWIDYTFVSNGTSGSSTGGSTAHA